MTALPIISPPPEGVRLASPDDEAEVMTMCRRLHAENGVFAMADEKIQSFIRKGIARDNGILGVIGPSGSIQASVCLTVAEMWYTRTQHLEEVWTYVMPEYRNSQNAKNLIAYAKWCSDTIGLPLLIGIMSNTSLEAKQRLYKRQLGDPAGVFYLHRSKKLGTG